MRRLVVTVFAALSTACGAPLLAEPRDQIDSGSTAINSPEANDSTANEDSPGSSTNTSPSPTMASNTTKSDTNTTSVVPGSGIVIPDQLYFFSAFSTIDDVVDPNGRSPQVFFSCAPKTSYFQARLNSASLRDGTFLHRGSCDFREPLQLDLTKLSPGVNTVSLYVEPNDKPFHSFSFTYCPHDWKASVNTGWDFVGANGNLFVFTAPDAGVTDIYTKDIATGMTVNRTQGRYRIAPGVVQVGSKFLFRDKNTNSASYLQQTGDVYAFDLNESLPSLVISASDPNSTVMGLGSAWTSTDMLFGDAYCGIYYSDTTCKFRFFTRNVSGASPQKIAEFSFANPGGYGAPRILTWNKRYILTSFQDADGTNMLFLTDSVAATTSKILTVPYQSYVQSSFVGDSWVTYMLTDAAQKSSIYAYNLVSAQTRQISDPNLLGAGYDYGFVGHKNYIISSHRPAPYDFSWKRLYVFDLDSGTSFFKQISAQASVDSIGFLSDSYVAFYTDGQTRFLAGKKFF